MSENRLKHLALIMDGNGRWAQQRGLRRTEGHKKGAETIRDITKYCSEHPEIETVTFYAFSTENWKRPKYEVDYLMRLLDNYLKNELETYRKYDIKFQVIGDTGAFSKALRHRIEATVEATETHRSLTQILALNYGGRAEIVRAVKKLCNRDEPLTEENITQALQTPYGDVDLLIRTSGEQRLSNFLLWQISYAELTFTDTLWPDFTAEELDTIIEDFKTRKRRFGGI